MGRIRTRVVRLEQLLPDPRESVDGLVVTTKDGRYDLEASGSGGGVTSVTATAPLASSGGATPDISHNASGVTAGSYTSANITVDAEGHVTAAADGGSSGATDGAISLQIGPTPGTLSPILAPQVIFLQSPANYAFTGWQIACDPAATISADVRKHAFPTRPTSGDSITAGHPIAASAATSATASSLASWSDPTATRGDWLAFAITANDLATFISIELQGTKS